MSAIKVFKKKEPVAFEYDGETFYLPGEMPVSATLYLYEMNARDGSEPVTEEDIRMLYSVLLGEETATRLIDEYQAGQETLEEIIQWYGSVLAERKRELGKSQPARQVQPARKTIKRTA